MNVLPLFPTAIIKDKFDVTKEVFDHLISLKCERTLTDDGEMSLSMDILNHRKLRHVKKHIDGVVGKYIHDICKVSNNIDLELVSSWTLMHDPGDYAPSHLHTNCVLSGVWYIKTQKNCGRFVLIRDVLPFGSTFEFDVTEQSMFNSFEWFLEPEIGDLYIFPSHMRHRVEKNKSDEKRISLAFNYYPRGKVRSEENYTRI